MRTWSINFQEKRMTTRFVGRASLSILLAGSVALAGCAAKNHKHKEYDTWLWELEQKVDKLGSAKPQTVTVKEEGMKKGSRLSAVPEGYSGAWMAVPTGEEATSALLVEKMVPERVVAGSDYESYIVVTNITEGLVLQDVVLKDMFYNGYALKSSSPAASASTGSGATWNLGTLEPGKSVKITLTGGSATVGEIRVCSVVDYTPVLCIDTLAEKPALALEKTGTPSALLCDEINYTITVTNTGTGNASNVKVVDNLPAGVATVDGKTSLTYEVASLGAGESKTFDITAKAARTGSFTNNATASADNGLSASSGNVTTVVCQPVLDATVTAEEAQTFAGRKITFNGTVANTGDCASEDTVVTMTVPECTTFASANADGKASGNVVTWNVGKLEAGASRNFVLTVQADEICIAKTEIAAEGVCAVKDSAPAQTELVGIPAVLLEVVDISDPIKVGNTETYEIKVTNQGTALDTNIRLKATLPNFEPVSAEGPTNGTIAGNTVTFAPLGSLAPKESKTWTIKARATQAGNIRAAFEMTTDEIGTVPVSETESTNIYQ